VLDAVTDRHVIPVVDVDRPELKELHIPATGAAPATGQQVATVPTGATQTLNGTGALGAVNITSFLTEVETTGAATATLEVAAAGIQKRIRMTADVGDCVITVAGTGIGSITLNDVSDQIDLISDGAGWIVLDNQGCTVA
jgi:hypothetical protein